MSAQGATIQVRRPVRVPTRLLAVVVATVAAATIGAAGIGMVTDDDTTARPAMHAGPAERGHRGTQPALHDRVGDATAMPVQRLYPEGFGASDEGSTAIRSGVRRKW